MNVIAKSLLLSAAIALGCGTSVVAQKQNWPDTSKINNWFDEHKDKQYNIQAPTKEIQKPGNIQKSGDIAIPQGWKAVSEKKAPCEHRLSVCADTLFEFDKSTLTPDAEATLKLVGPKICALGSHPVKIEGHTDAIGTDEYNQDLSMRRAERVRNWLAQNHFIPISSDIEGFGKKKPVAPNTLPNGKDNPPGRQKNRRVEIVVDTCKTLDSKPVETSPVRTSPAAETTPATGDAPPVETTPPETTPVETK